jgi:pimeloyl-ACP methyl ester carboxylesterase
MLITTSRSLSVSRNTLQTAKRVTNDDPKDQNISISQEDPDKGAWDDLIKPEPGEGRKVDVGRRAGEGTDSSMAATRSRLDSLDFHALDPYVATVASGVAASQVNVPGKGESKVRISLEPYFEKRFELYMGTHNGPDAPMLVILPGVFGTGQGSHSDTLKKLALERGMNYVALPNSLSMESLRDRPRDHPGNPRLSALVSYKAVQTLKDQFPQYFEKVSVAGYSYGALNGANLVRYEEELMDQNPGMERLITGSLVSVSPPENLAHSMLELDGLREKYKEGSGSIIGNGLKYKKHVRRYGYEDFLSSELAARGPGENLTEIKISDKYGSLDGLKKMVDKVDYDFGQKRLPMNKPEFWEGTEEQRDEWQREHIAILDNMTYAQFSDQYMSQDQWLRDQGLTPDQMAAKYSFSNAMEIIDDTPVMVLLSADDYILNGDDISQYRKLEANPGELEAVKIFDNGGHVGLTWNPQIQETMADFLFKAPREHHS